MTTKNTPLSRVMAALCNGNLGLAIAEMDVYLSAWPQTQTIERLAAVKAEYDRMQDGWTHGEDESDRISHYRKLLQQVYIISANVLMYHSMMERPAMSALYSRVRTEPRDRSLAVIRQEMEGYVSDVAMLQLVPENKRQQRSDAVYRTHQQQMNALFNSILTSRQWTDGVALGFEKMLLSPTIDTIDQQLIVSAVTLSLMNQFDMAKFRLLTNVYEQAHDEAVRQRALVGWVLGADVSMSAVYPEQQDIVRRLAAQTGVCDELTELQMQLVFCFKAEKDTSTIRQEIMPDLLKNNSFRVTRKGLEEMDEDPMEDILNPGASEKRMEQVEASFQRMIDMQKQGSDIFFGGFSQMKRFPFFYDICNWLIPFYMQHPDIQQYVKNFADNKFLQKMIQEGPFCNSDKYSFVIAFQQMYDKLTPNIREMLKHGEATLGVAEDIEQEHTPAHVRRSYLMDLYRFFRLYPQRNELHNPFNDSDGLGDDCGFMRQSLYDDTLVESRKKEVVRLLYKHGFQREATLLLATFKHEYQDAQYFIWTANYLRALELEPDNVTALAKRARELYEKGCLQEALEHYDHLQHIRPGHIAFQLGRAVCLIDLERYEEVLAELYKLYYEDEHNNNVNRVLAWALMSSGRLEQAGNIYAKLAQEEEPVDEDLKNYGYCLWLQKRIGEAARVFKRSLDSSNTSQQYRLLDFESDASWLRQRGISRTDGFMMQSLVMSL